MFLLNSPSEKAEFRLNRESQKEVEKELKIKT
jgi:hypothetical protein